MNNILMHIYWYGFACCLFMNASFGKAANLLEALLGAFTSWGGVAFYVIKESLK